MKKIILTLLSLVLICAMCIGFVACDEEGNGYNPDVDNPVVDNPDDGQKPTPLPILPTIPGKSLSNYMIEQPFSFGTCGYDEVDFEYEGVMADTIHTILNNAEYMMFDTDIAFANTISAMQLAVDEHMGTLLGVDSSSEDYITISLQNETVGNKAIVTIKQTEGLPEDAENFFANLGQGAVQTSKNGLLRGDIIHEVYDLDDYICVYASRTRGVDVSFYTYIYHEDMDRKFELCTNIYFDFESEAPLYAFDQILKNYASVEERHDIAQYYQAVHKEIMTSWASSEEGKNYLEYWKRPN